MYIQMAYIRPVVKRKETKRTREEEDQVYQKSWEKMETEHK